MSFCCYSLQARYCWPELIKRRLSRSDYNHSEVCIATSLLVAVAVIGEFFFFVPYGNCLSLFEHSNFMVEHMPLEQVDI
jgi:hypothetical protein